MGVCNPVPVLGRLTHVRWNSWRRGLLLTICWSLAACATSSHAGSTGDGRSPADSAGTGQTEHVALSPAEYKIAKNIALREAERTARSVTSATATRSAGTVLDSNTGHECTSGTVLHIKLIGDFNIVHGFAPIGVAKSSNDDVHAELITADADSGQMCLIAVETGEVQPDPGATVLFTNWTP